MSIQFVIFIIKYFRKKLIMDKMKQGDTSEGKGISIASQIPPSSL